MCVLFVWCVFESYWLFSDCFFQDDLLDVGMGSVVFRQFEQFLFDCGIYLFDLMFCVDGCLVYIVVYVLCIFFSVVCCCFYVGVMFDVENMVNCWVKIEYCCYCEGLFNFFMELICYLKVVIYYFSFFDFFYQGCVVYGSNDELVVVVGYQCLFDFCELVENSFCCGVFVDFLLIGFDIDIDVIWVYFLSCDSEMVFDCWFCVRELYVVIVLMSVD